MACQSSSEPPPDHRSMAVDHRRTTAGPSPDHRSMVVDRQLTGGSWSGLGPDKVEYWASRMKNNPTTKEKEEMRRPTVEKFQRLLDNLINYNEVHTTMLFDPKKRRNIRPKVIFFLEASPKDVYDYFVHGLVYINDETFKELQEFPLKVQSMIKGYKEIFARGRELFLKMRFSYPIFDKEQKLLVPSITVAQLGVSNKGYQDKYVKIECTPPTIDDLIYSFMEVLAGSSKIEKCPREKDKIKINYCSKNLLIYLKFEERIDEVQLKVLSDFEDQIELFLGLLASLPEDLKQRLCRYMTRNSRHHYHYCSEVLKSRFRILLVSTKFLSIVVLDVGISLVPTHAADQGRIDDTQISDQPEEQLGVFSAATALADAARRRQIVENVQTYTK
ncbi:hypothetical protein Tco_0555909 [Tanacetum coccineum]